MNEPLTSQEVEQIKVEIQTHFGTLLSGLIDKEDIVNLAEPYAINLFTRLTNSNQPIVHSTSILHTKFDPSLQRWIEETYAQQPEEVLGDVLSKSNEVLLEWHIATKVAARFVENELTMPKLLQSFTSDVLLAKQTMPTSRTSTSKTVRRDDAIFSCLHWLTTDDTYGIRKTLNITSPIAVYSNSDSATNAPTAVTLICEAINDSKFKKATGHKLCLEPGVVTNAYKLRC